MKTLFWIAITTFFLAMFLILSSEVQESIRGEPELVGKLDKWATDLVETRRSPNLNSIAIDITALGSATVISIFLVATSGLLIFKQKFRETLHILIAGFGAAALSFIMKSYFERPRPISIPHLVDVQGYSYPSGHSLASSAVYFTFAVLLCHYFNRKRERVTIVSFASALIGLIALSRIYLGVHYASDTIAGVLLGIGWAALLASASEFLLIKRRRNGFQ